jgi:hypothetical protein
MAASRIGLFDLLAPQYLAGLTFPEYIHRYLSLLGVDELQTLYDDGNIMYYGTASFEGEGSGNDVVHEEPGGTRFTWERRNILFRLLVPRDGAEFIDRAANHSPATGRLPEVSLFLNTLKPSPDADMDTLPVPVIDYPGSGYRLELLIDALNFTLGEEWKPGRIDPADNRIRFDEEHVSERVQIKLPKVLLSYSQGDDSSDLNPQFNLEGWGIAGFDSPADVEMGELIRMSHPFAVHQSEHVAFSVDKIIVDFSENATPPELLEHFGVDEGWKGVYAKQLLFYYSNDQGVGFNLRVKDALIGFNGQVSFEAALDVYPILTLGLFSVTPRFYNGQEPVSVQSDGNLNDSISTAPSTDPPGRVTVRQGAVMQLEISGGTPPYTIETSEGGINAWDSSTRQMQFNTVGDHNIFIRVVDSQTGVNQRRHSSYYHVHVNAAPSVSDPPSGTSSDRPPSSEPLQTLTSNVTSGNDSSHVLTIEEDGSRVNLRITTGAAPYSIVVRDASSEIARSESRDLQVNVPNNSDYTVTVDFPAPAGSFPGRSLQFPFAHPTTAEVSNYSNLNISVPAFNAFRSAFMQNLPDVSQVTAISINGHASRENEDNDAYDDALSNRRVEVANNLLSTIYSGGIITSNPGTGHRSPLPNDSNHQAPENRVAVVTFTSAPGVSAHTITATLSRPPAPAPPQPEGHQQPAVTGTPPAAPAMPNDLPPVIKQLGIRVKVERNKLSLLELYGKIDIETEMEKNIRTGISDSTPSQPENSGTLDLQHGNAHDGEIDFKLTYQYDNAINETTLIFMLHSDERDTDGLLHMDNNANRDDRFKNIFGALLLFAPIINSAASSAASDSQDAGAWIALGTSIAVPVAIGGLNVFRTRKIILYGGEARTKFVTPKPGDPLRSFDIGLAFDYEVQFDIIIEALSIGENRLPGAPSPLPPPLRARYKAIGFNIHYADLPASGTTPAYKGVQYTPVFDSSKGYDLDLSDPSLFSLPNPLGSLFNIAGARLARFNPVTLEVDFAIKVDLGVITVDKFKLKIPLDPVGAPQIIPSGVRVNIPGVLLGSGFVEVIDADIPDENGNTVHAKGVEGGLDLTLVALKVRLCANIGLGTLHDSTNNRDAVSVFVGMRAEFPTPIILFQTGLGIYGFMGLFAMHYKRLEDPPDPTSAVGPALGWLVKADGDPTKLKNSASVRLWQMAMDKWAFGVGVILGTIDGGILMNFQGMLVLELPGPRILVMVKMKIVSVLPSQPATPASVLTTGIIGIIDLDFGRKTLTLGVLVSFEIKSILSVSLPIELFFDMQTPSNWHLWIGTILNPASANILDIVRGSAYLMIQGNDLVYPDNNKVPQIFRNKTLSGIAIAAGLEASIVLGDEGSGIYLKISAGAHLGLSFSPFLVIGTMYFSGKLRLLIISIGASGHFDIIVSQIQGTSPADYKTYMHGEVCGSIDLFFFEISACIGITVGDDEFDFEAPPLVRGLYLQSFSPVLSSGQGASKPIDASLGNGSALGDSSEIDDPSELLVVPIDTVPVIQFNSSPLLSPGFEGASFVTSPGNISGSNGVLKLSEENSVEYTLTSVTLTEAGVPYDSGGEKPPSVWRIDRPNGASVSDTSIDLATFSRVPTATEHALERSTDLRKNVTIRWANACSQAAPPAPVLFTFCGQPIGVSQNGWLINGVPKPDPDGTVRTTPVNTSMKVYQPRQEAANSTLGFVLNELGAEYTVPARVVGLEKITLPTVPGQKKCFDLRREKVSFQTNPLLLEKELRIYSASEKRAFYNKTKGFISFDEFKIFESPYRTHFRSIKKFIGLSIREYMRIDVISEPVQKLQLKFTSFRMNAKLIAYGYDENGTLVDKETFVHKDDTFRINELTLSAESIKYVIIYNRNFTGQFVEICYERGGNSHLENYYRCLRSLQLPYQDKWKDEQRNDSKLLEELSPYLKGRKYYSEVIFETGACEKLIFYAAVFRKMDSRIVVDEMDVNNHVIQSHKLSDLITKIITNPAADLPADWLSPSLPWNTNLLPTALYLQSFYFNAFERILFELKPGSDKCVKIRISTFKAKAYRPVMYVSAVETLQLSEIEHHETMSGVLETEKNTIDNYLNDHTPVPLLNPDQVYIMSVNYDVKKTRKGTSLGAQSMVQNFAFKTDNLPPKELKPYVLGATPEMDDRFHFYEDALKVVFNDASFLRMIEAYGKSIRAIIRGADGVPVNNSPELMHTLEDIPASVLSAYRDSILILIREGFLPCLGSITMPSHAAYTSPFVLKPLMSYTFDLEFDEPDTTPDNQPKIPFYRRAFSTSRFANLQDFVRELRTGRINHKALKNVIAGMPPASGPESVHTITDVEFENAISGSGIAQKDNLTQTSCTLLWSNNSGDFVPYGLLIESAEPVWRMRTEAEKVNVLNQQNVAVDPAFEVVQNKLTEAMKLRQKSGQDVVSHFVKSTGGTRTLIFFKDQPWPEAGKQLTVEIVQTASTLYNMAEKVETIYDLKLTAKAPWED